MGLQEISAFEVKKSRVFFGKKTKAEACLKKRSRKRGRQRGITVPKADDTFRSSHSVTLIYSVDELLAILHAFILFCFKMVSGGINAVASTQIYRAGHGVDAEFSLRG